MKRNGLLAAVLAVMFLMVCTTMVAAAEKAATTKKGQAKAAEPVKLTGTVVAVKDAKGVVTGSLLRTDKGEEYKIIGAKNKDLQNLADKKVEVTGAVKVPKDPKAKKSINVTEFKEVGK